MRSRAVMIGSINSHYSAKSGNAKALKTAPAEPVSEVAKNRGASRPQNGDTLKISALASQIATSVSRAEAVNKALTHSELADMAKSVMDKVAGDSYTAKKSTHDSEVPNTNDPELLSRAKQATAFVNDASGGGSSINNPFSGLSREQLSGIIYDDSGAYTVNERHAAWRESYDQEEVWREMVTAKAMAEYNSTGRLTNFFKSVLDHFKELPAIEQAQYPDDYADNLQSKIDMNFNFFTHEGEGKGSNLESSIELLLAQGLQQRSGFVDIP